MIFITKYLRYIRKKASNYIKFYKDRSYIVRAYKYLRLRKVLLIYFELPRADKIKNLTPFEIDRIQNWVFNVYNIEEEMPKLKMLYGDDIDPDYIISLYDGGNVVNDGKRKRMVDFVNDYVHIINGVRLTTGQPDNWFNKIYTLGSCTVRGTGVEDSQTIASYLQEDINRTAIGKNTYSVVNMGIGRTSNIYDDFEQMKEQQYTPGDVVVWIPFTPLNASHLPKGLKNQKAFYYYETSSLFDRPHEFGEWFTDSVLHTNKTGNKIIADYIFEKISDISIIRKNNELVNDKTKTYNIVPQGTKIYADNPELKKYLKRLRSLKKGDANSLIGCIVMNCNPFTNGHKYLVEYAAPQVDFLYIFVVEENKSYFSFEDRLDLIKQGTAHLKNVTVLPSGKFIISILTFPGYFIKDDIKDATIDCSNDINVFAQHIAPVLNIKVRFAGEEPLDPVTNQYNKAMSEILPSFFIQFSVIPRKESAGQVISASRVRRYYENGNMDELKELVPISTYNYLLNRYNNRHISA